MKKMILCSCFLLIISIPTLSFADDYIVDLGNEVTVEMVLCPGGEFQMGSPEGEIGRNIKTEVPVHDVTLHSFYIGKYEVTNKQWNFVMGIPSKGEGCENCPVENISWFDTQIFIKKLNEITGKVFRLPTEAEWEYACRAGTNTPFAYGDCISYEQANYKASAPMDNCDSGEYRKRAIPVGSFEPNRFGLHDMHGNVSEFCQDWFQEAFYQSKLCCDNPVCNEEKGGFKIIRGGGWRDKAIYCRSSARRSMKPTARSNNGVGLRLALSK